MFSKNPDIFFQKSGQNFTNIFAKIKLIHNFAGFLPWVSFGRGSLLNAGHPRKGFCFTQDTHGRGSLLHAGHPRKEFPALRRTPTEEVPCFTQDTHGRNSMAAPARECKIFNTKKYKRVQKDRTAAFPSPRAGVLSTKQNTNKNKNARPKANG